MRPLQGAPQLTRLEHRASNTDKPAEASYDG